MNEPFFTLRPRHAGKATEQLALAAMERRLLESSQIKDAAEAIYRAMLESQLYGVGALWHEPAHIFMHLPIRDVFAWPAPVEIEIPPLVPVRARAPGRLSALTAALMGAYQPKDPNAYRSQP